MQFPVVAVALAYLAAAARVDLSRRESGLEVKLELVGATAVRAIVANKGDDAVKVLKTGSILDESPNQKADVFSNGEKVQFGGVSLRVSTVSLPEEAFLVIPAGEAAAVEFDVAETFDLSGAGGSSFDVVATGAIDVAADVGSVEVDSAVAYTSNMVTITGVDAARGGGGLADAAKRSIVTQCSGSRRTSTVRALANCQSYANRARSAAQSGSAARMVEFFKSSSSSVRRTVASVYGRVAKECSSSTSGVARYYCTDIFNFCRPGVVAYAIPSQSIMVNCPLYFSFPARSSRCYATDQVGTTLHEVTHLRQIKGTQDYGSYGYNAVQALSASQNLNHADTYELFSQAVNNNCPVRT